MLLTCSLLTAHYVSVVKSSDAKTRTLWQEVNFLHTVLVLFCSYRFDETGVLFLPLRRDWCSVHTASTRLVFCSYRFDETGVLFLQVAVHVMMLLIHRNPGLPVRFFLVMFMHHFIFSSHDHTISIYSSWSLPQHVYDLTSLAVIPRLLQASLGHCLTYMSLGNNQDQPSPSHLLEQA